MDICPKRSPNQAENDLRYLKLDQTTSQSVINGLPIFQEGIRIGNATTYFLLNGDDLELWVNGTKCQTWTNTAVYGYLMLEDDSGCLLLEDGSPLLLEG